MKLDAAAFQLIHKYENYTLAELRGILAAIRDETLHLPSTQETHTLQAEVIDVIRLRTYLQRHPIKVIGPDVTAQV